MLDAIVLGLGAMGSATLYQLAKRGRSVLGIDRHSPPHALGSSHGDTRVTREAIGEGVMYSPLALRSHAIWREIEAATGEPLLATCGCLVLSSRSDRAVCHVPGFYDNTLAAARRHGIAHETLAPEAVRERFPQFAVRDDAIAYYEAGAGFVRPEACIEAQLRLAERSGARIHRNEAVRAFEDRGDHVGVATDRSEYRARTLVVTAGPWLPGLLPGRWSRFFRVTRQTLFWFGIEPPIERFTAPRFPVFIWELPGESQPIYGFPALDGAQGGLKVATESTDATTTPAEVDREVSAAEWRDVFDRLVAPYVKGLRRECVRATTCLYTMTPDSHFVIDRHPAMPSVWIVSPCSGHGFKHSAAIGECVAQAVSGEALGIDITPFAFSRFG
jgi:sarcosine oxidase